VYGIAKTLADAGYRVVVGSGEDVPSEIELIEREGEGELCHIGLGELNRSLRSRAFKAFKALVAQGANTVRWLEAEPIKPSCVIVYGGYAAFMARVLRWCRQNGVAVVADVVEWYEPTHLPGGRWGPFNASTNAALRHYYPKCDGVIAISSMLERYYQERGVRAIRVPPTLDVAGVRPREASADERSSGPLVLVYAGSPGKKDLLANVIRGVRAADSEGHRLRLDVLGVTESEAMRLLAPGEPLPSSVRVVGRVPQAQVVDAYRAADFSVLLREPLRYAEAGFPTKVPESLAAGVPVICNLTSDLREHVRDGVEGLVCGDHSVEGLASALHRALALEPAARSEMARAARRAAERSFDYRNYRDSLIAFLEEVQR
jgi:glycosyltransferase involved in cell wall biosynthesis